jgi:hypothetical protein
VILWLTDEHSLKIILLKSDHQLTCVSKKSINCSIALAFSSLLAWWGGLSSTIFLLHRKLCATAFSVHTGNCRTCVIDSTCYMYNQDVPCCEQQSRLLRLQWNLDTQLQGIVKQTDGLSLFVTFQDIQQCTTADMRKKHNVGCKAVVLTPYPWKIDELHALNCCCGTVGCLNLHHRICESRSTQIVKDIMSIQSDQ